MPKRDLLLPSYELPGTLVQSLRDQNSWWENRPLPVVPKYRRWPFTKLLARLQKPLAPILVVRGPRQVGKTTLQLQLLEELLGQGVEPKRILRVQFDDLPTLRHVDVKGEPILRIAEWFQTTILHDTFNGSAQKRQPAFLFLDEVQNLASWAPQLKFLVDTHPGGLRVLVTGSSALRIKLGDDSLAGRLQGFEVGPLRLAEIAELRGLGQLVPVQDESSWDQWTRPDFWQTVHASGLRQAAVRDQAFTAFSERGAYPFCHVNADVGWAEVSDHLKQTVINRVIQFDLRLACSLRVTTQPRLRTRELSAYPSSHSCSCAEMSRPCRYEHRIPIRRFPEPQRGGQAAGAAAGGTAAGGGAAGVVR